MLYPLPHIKYIIYKLSNFTSAATLDLIMGYYNLSLTDASNKICTITKPFSKYKHNSIPMRVCIEPDILQEQMSALMEKL